MRAPVRSKALPGLLPGRPAAGIVEKNGTRRRGGGNRGQAGAAIDEAGTVVVCCKSKRDFVFSSIIDLIGIRFEHGLGNTLYL